MQRLILLRHGQAEPAQGGSDRDRPLTARGWDDARRIGAWLAASGERVELSLVSPALRARQTWEAAGAAFPSARAEYPGSLYAADPTDMLDRAEAGEAGTVALVAHNPGLHALALQLLHAGRASPSITAALLSDFPPASVAVFARDDAGGWSTVDYQTPAKLEPAAT